MTLIATNEYATSQESEFYVKILGVTVPDNTATYVSTPITGGELFLEWYVRTGRNIKSKELYRQLHQQAVVEPNCENASAVIGQYRKHDKLTVIDPTAFHRPGWAEADYLGFWSAVIRRYAAQVAFMDGWQCSGGCATEFLVAAKLGLRSLDQRLKPLSVPEGTYLITEAVKRYKDKGVPADTLKRVSAELNGISS